MQIQTPAVVNRHGDGRLLEARGKTALIQQEKIP